MFQLKHALRKLKTVYFLMKTPETTQNKSILGFPTPNLILDLYFKISFMIQNKRKS